jgi:hypothetical protein
VAELIVALTPLKNTALSCKTVLYPLPLMVTWSPGAPEIGEKELMLGWEKLKAIVERHTAKVRKTLYIEYYLEMFYKVT